MDDRLKLQWIDGQRPSEAAARSAEAPLGSPVTPADAALVARVARADRAIQAGLEDLPIPSGLAERLRARLADPALTQPTLTSAVEAPVALPHQRTARSRRQWLGRAAAASVGLATGGWLLERWLAQPTTPWGAQELLEAAFDQLETDLAHEPQALATADRAQYPLPLNLLSRGVRCSGWSESSFLGRSALCYHLERGERQAALWAAPLAGQRALPAELGYQPYENGHSTRGVVGCVWQSREVLYVAATTAPDGGGLEQLKHFIATGDRAVAMLMR